MTIPSISAHGNRIYLRKLADLDDALELMYFGLKGMTREADDLLPTYGLSRAHHRIMFVIARHEGVDVGTLIAALGVTKQAANRPMRRLFEGRFVAATREPGRHRNKALHFTQLGRDVERKASDCERAVMRAAFERAGKCGRTAWSSVESRTRVPTRKSHDSRSVCFRRRCVAHRLIAL